MTGESATVKPSGAAATARNSETNCLDGLKTSELEMIRRLAGNDPLVRKRTMKKLRKWLYAIASRIPDAPESRDLVDSNFVRVWKALFYCMWMADKPLPQEQLAEQISNLLSIFSSKPNLLMFFMDWFFMTIGREWSQIDRYRLDKFMMLIRRFLRKSLEQLSLQKWNKKILAQFVQILSVHIFNRHPPVKKTRAKARVPDPPNAPLGFQIHFTDIFLEELAKVGSDTLKSDAILQLLSPFIHELAFNDDDRLLGEIKERVFNHLMKQSDAAFDHLEGPDESDDDEDEDEESDSDMEVDENENDVEQNGNKDDESDEDDEEMDYNQPLDPRAGQVNVILPQLDIAYDTLSQKLVEAGGQCDVKNKNKKMLFALARGMNELTEGRYPLALPETGPRNPAISKKEVKIAAERLVALEEEFNGDKLRRKTKKERKREMKLAAADLTNDNSMDSVGSEDQSAYLVDDELPDHVGDNYLSYLEEMKNQGKEKNSNKKRKLSKEESSAQEQEAEQEIPQILQTPLSPQKKLSPLSPQKDLSPQKRQSRLSQPKNLSPQKIQSQLSPSPQKNLSPKKIQDQLSPQKNLTPQKNQTQSPQKNHIQSPQKNQIQSPKKGQIQNQSPQKNQIQSPKKGQIQNQSPQKKQSPEKLNPASGGSPNSTKQPQTDEKTPLSQTPGQKPKLKGLRRLSLQNRIGTPTTPAAALSTSVTTTPASLRKRVSFVLARNSEHPHADYQHSIQRSPAIPYDSDKKPNFGLLKSPAKLSTLLQNSTPTQRKRAADFF